MAHVVRRSIGYVSLAALVIGYCSMPAIAQDNKSPRDAGRGQPAAKVTEFQETKSQDKGQNDADKVADSYQPKGIEAGQFLVLPKLEIGENYNSNVYGQRHLTENDFYTLIAPDLKIRSRFIQHELNFGLHVDEFRYIRLQHDNRRDYRGEVDGRFDLDSETKLTHYSQISLSHEDRTSPDALNGVRPTPTTALTNHSGVEHKAGRYTLGTEFWYDRKTFSATEFSGGGRSTNADRDRWEYKLAPTVSYEMFPGYSVLGAVSKNIHTYDRPYDRNGFKRSSNGYRAETGIGIDISKLIRGDFLVGYMTQDYEDKRLKDVKGLAFRANFSWTPTKLTTIQPGLERSVSDTTTTGASGLVHNGFTLTVKHELARNIILTGYSSASRDEFQGGRNNNYWMYELGGTIHYSFTPELYVEGELRYKTKDSTIDSSSFNQTTSMIKIGLQY